MDHDSFSCWGPLPPIKEGFYCCAYISSYTFLPDTIWFKEKVRVVALLQLVSDTTHYDILQRCYSYGKNSLPLIYKGKMIKFVFIYMY